MGATFRIGTQPVSEVCTHHVLLQHPLRIEERSIQRNGMTHDVNEVIPMTIKHWQDDLGQLVVKRSSIASPVAGDLRPALLLADGPSGHTFQVTLNPPA